MKKALIGLLSICCVELIYSQEAVHLSLEQISRPFKYFSDASVSPQNFLFGKNWLKGKILAADNSVITSDSFYFNIDKIGNELIITHDFENIYEVDRREFKAVMFYSGDSAFIFKRIEFINEKDLFEVLVNDKNGYCLYKVTRSKLLKGHLGLGSFGSSRYTPFDKFIDIAQYVIVFPNREFRKLHQLKKAAIERVFDLHADSRRVDGYLNTLNVNKCNEGELIELIAFLNKNAS